MEKPRLGIVGTGMISAEFAAAVRNEKAFDIGAVMSRQKESAARFIRENQLGKVPLATSIEELVAFDLDAVYIASPNSLHKNHALVAIEAGLSVIVEKPAFWNPQEFEQVHTAAQEAGVLVLEAARHTFEPGFALAKEWATGHSVTGASLNFHQYSSRWEAVTAGKEPNIFSLNYGGGALVDLGIYAVYAAVAWFGEPQTVLYYPQLAPTGVDAGGILLLNYPGFTAELSFSKNQSSSLPSEIRAGQQTLVLSSVQGIDWLKTADGQSLFQAEDRAAPLRELMRAEAHIFSQLITAQGRDELTGDLASRYEELTALSRTVNRICTEARHSAGIVFQGEKP